MVADDPRWPSPGRPPLPMPAVKPPEAEPDRRRKLAASILLAHITAHGLGETDTYPELARAAYMAADALLAEGARL